MDCPLSESRCEEIRNGSPISEPERKAYEEWLAVRREKHIRAGKLGGRPRTDKPNPAPRQPYDLSNIEIPGPELRLANPTPQKESNALTAKQESGELVEKQ